MLYLAIAFKLWMIWDAIRRRAHVLWFVVLLAPLGDFVYFFAVKLGTFKHIRPARPAEEKPQVDLEALRKRAEASPSFAHRAELGWGLLEQQQPTEAEEVFRKALASHRGDRDGLFGLGSAQVALGQHEEAIETLTELVYRGLAYRDYLPALLLVRALFEAGRQEEAFDLMHSIARHSRRYEHAVQLGRLLLEGGNREEAREVLSATVAEFEAEPDYLRRRYGATATEARQLLRTLDGE